MSPSRFAVRRPVTTVMFVLMAVLLGVIGFQSIPVDLLPDIEYPILVVVARYPGAAPVEVENLVTRRLEEAVAAMAGLDRIQSSSSEGLAMVVARFAWGTNLDQAAIDVRERLDMVARFLPQDVEHLSVIKADMSALPVMRIDLAGMVSIEELTDLANDVVKPAIERLDGIASVSVVGGVERKVFVDVDPRILETYTLSISHVTAALRQENLSLPGGDILYGTRRAKVRTLGEFADLYDMSLVQIVSPSGAVVRLEDIARISAKADEMTGYARYNGQPSVCLYVQKQSGTNTVQVARDVMRAVQHIASTLPPGVTCAVTEDQSNFINTAVATVSQSALFGAVLAVIVLFLFLQDWRSTVVIGLSIPVSLVATCALMYFGKLTFNLMSLGGLALGVGMLVDNSIVVLENIYRHHQHTGLEPAAAAIRGTEEVGMAITASTLTNLAVFLPIAFTSDLASHLFRELALTVTFSIGCSLVSALTVVPVAASWILKMGQSGEAKGTLSSSVGGFLSKVASQYRAGLAYLLDRLWIAAAVVVLAIGSALLIYPYIGTEFLPAMDRGEIRIEVSCEKGTRLDDTDEVVRLMERAVAEFEETSMYTSSVGGSDYAFAAAASGGSELGSISVKLDAQNGVLSTQEVREQLLKVAETVPGARISVSQVKGVVGEDQFMGAPIEVSISGEDHAVLRELAREVEERLKRVDSVRNVKSEVEEGSPEVQVRVDRTRAAYAGMSAGQIGVLVRAAIQGETATRLRVAGTEYDVVVRLDSAYRDSVPDIQNMLLPGASGQVTPLWQVADVVRDVGPVSINRRNQVRVVRVQAEVSGRDLGSVLQDAEEEVGKIVLPEGCRVEFTGQTREMMAAFSSLGFVLVISLLLTYMVLAAQFESLSQPFVIMTSVPLAALGSVLALFLTGHAMNVPSIIGLITLAGIVVNNAIVFVDYTNQLRKEGMDVRNALLQAGATRFRPILMTSLTTVFGLVPMAVGGGKGSELTAPLALAIMGGLLTSTLLTLFIVPVGYLVLTKITSRMGRPRSATVLSVVLLVMLAAGIAPGTVAAAAQHEISLEQARDRAVDTSDALKLIDAKLRQARFVKIQADLAASQVASVSTYDEAKTKYLLPAQAQAAIDVLERMKDATIENLVYGAAAAYYSLVKLNELASSASALVEAASEQLQVASLYYDAGIAVQQHVMSARASYWEAVYASAMLESLKKSATLSLLDLTGYSPHDSLIVSSIYGPSQLGYGDVETLVTQALANRFEIYSAEKDVQTAQLALQLANTYPPLLPLEVQYLQDVVTEAQIKLNMQKRSIEFAVRAQVPQVEAARVKFSAKSEAYAKAHEEWRTVRARHEQGLATETEVMMAAALADQAKAAYTESLADFEIAKARLVLLCSKGSVSTDL